MFSRPIVRSKGGAERAARVGEGFLAMPRVVINASAGAQTITTEQIMAGVARFTGAAGAVNYTTDTAANILAAMPEMDIGDTYTFAVSNTAAQTATILGGTGVTVVGGNATVNASMKMCVLERSGTATMNLYCL